MQSSEHSKGFEKNESILNNAKPHVGCVCVLNIDLKDFFPSVKASRVYGIFSSIGYNRELCVLLTNLCVFKGSLPQGAPTSPKLANLVCSKLDRRIGGYAGSRGLVYTRYADDITLSAPTIKKVKKAKQFLGTIVASESLVINKRKTRVIGTRKQKSITGLILSENRVGIGRARFREIRAKLHSLFVERSSEFNKVNGLLAFTYGVDKPSYRKLLKYIEKLCEKYPASKAVTEIHKIKFSEEKSSTPK
jgi:retron-type reverse transcriptase